MGSRLEEREKMRRGSKRSIRATFRPREGKRALSPPQGEKKEHAI